MADYWTGRSLRSRRALLRSAGLSGLGIAGLAAVGCSSGNNTNKSAASAVAAPSSAATAAASGATVAGRAATAAASGATAAAATVKKGGTWRALSTSDPTSLDPLFGSSFTTSLYGSYSYSRLTRYDAGPGKDPAAHRTVPDVALSIETPDVLTYVLKLRPNAKFHAPVSRAVSADDVIFSWKKSITQSTGTAVPVIKNVEAVDPQTVRITLNQSSATFLTEDRQFPIAPKETGALFDPAQKMVGTGPWIFESYAPSTKMTFVRNPAWHLGPDAPYFDRVEISIIPEYATGLNQFLGGNIDEFTADGSDLQKVLNSVKGAQIYRGELGLSWSYTSFSGNAADSSAPWRDERVRQAVSMSMDRDAMLDAAYNASDIAKLGVKVDRVWNNIVPASTKSFWLDPQGKYSFKSDDPKMDPQVTKNFKYDPQAAKQLLAAAGFNDGFKARWHYPVARYGDAFRIISELVPQMASKSGITLTSVPEDYASVFAPNSLLGNFDGLLHVAGGGGDPGINSFQIYYIPGQIRNNGHINDPMLTDQINKMLGEHDYETRRKDILALQNYTGQKMYYVPGQTGAIGSFVCYPSNVKNSLDYQVSEFDQGNETVPFYWKA